MEKTGRHPCGSQCPRTVLLRGADVTRTPDCLTLHCPSCTSYTGPEQIIQRRKSRLKIGMSPIDQYGNQPANQNSTSKNRTVSFWCSQQNLLSRSFPWKTHLLLSVIALIHIMLLPTATGQELSWKTIPTDTSVREGESVTIPCEVNNFDSSDQPMEWRQYLDNNVDDLTLFINSQRISAPNRFNVTSNGYGYSLKLTSATREDDTDLRCGIALWNDSRFRLTILVDPGLPAISLNQSEASLREGDYVEFRCSVQTGNPAPNFTWYRDDLAVAETSYLPPSVKYGPSESLLVRQLDKSDHMTYYRCDVENEANEGQPGSDDTQLQILYAPAIDLGSHDPLKVMENTSVTLTCNVDANPPVPDEQLTWLKGVDKQYFVAGKDCQFSSVKRENSDLYTCEAGNDIGTRQSSLSMDVLYGPQVSLEFSESYHDDVVEVVELQPLTMTCSADANPAVSSDDFRWYSESGTEVFRGPEYHLSSVSRSQAGTYKCETSNLLQPSEGQERTVSSSKSFTLQVLYAPGPASVSLSNTAIKGELTELTCSVEDPGVPTATFRWTMLMFPEKDFPETATLTFDPVELSDTGEYKCTPYNEVGEGPAAIFELDVNERPEWLLPVPPDSITVMVNTSLQLTCSSRGKPVPQVTWLKDGAAINPGAGLFTVEETETQIYNHSWNVTSTLKWQGSARLPFSSSLTHSDAGNYTCLVENDYSDIETQTRVTIYYSPYVEATSSKVAIDRNQSASMSCISHGAPSTTFEWYNSTTAQLVSGERIHISMNDQASEEFPYSSMLVISDVSSYDLGTYNCRGCNAMGCNAAGIDLTVKDLPDSPTAVVISSKTWESLYVSWTEGFDGGYPQTFEISLQYYDNVSASYQTDWEQAGTAPQYNVTGLFPSVNYTVTVYSKNALGTSDPSPSVWATTDGLLVPVPGRVEYDPEERLLYFTSPSSIYCARIEINSGDSWEVYAECAPVEGSVKIDEEWTVVSIRVSLCLTSRQPQDICSVPVLADFMGEDLSKNTIVIVGCVCGGVVVILTIVLVVLCCKRKQAKEQYEKQQHDSSPMQPVISNPSAISNHDNHAHKPAGGGVDNPSLDQVDSGNSWHGNHGNRPVYTTDNSGQAPSYKANGYPAGHLPNGGGPHWDSRAHYDNRHNMDILSGSSPLPKNKLYLDDSYQGESTTDHSPHNESGVSTPDPQKPRKVIYEVIV